MDFSEIPEKLLRVTNFHVYPPSFEKREDPPAQNDEQPGVSLKTLNFRIPPPFSPKRKASTRNWSIREC
jgi:hypothetical protein